MNKSTWVHNAFPASREWRIKLYFILDSLSLSEVSSMMFEYQDFRLELK
jgi:hypothetical protein